MLDLDSNLDADPSIESSITSQAHIDDERAAYSPKIAVVILNWNGLADTLECLNSVKNIDYPNFEIAVVDNGSTDGSVNSIRHQFPEITLLETGKNLGYAGGNNVGIRYALQHSAEYVLLLNNDTVVDPQLLKSFIAASYVVPNCSIFGAKIYFYSEPDKIWCAGGKWEDKLSRFILIAYGERDVEENYNQITEIDYACGCALFARSDLFNNVGFLDESFFLTYEETDLCFRAKQQGYKIAFVPEAKVWHKISASFGGNHSPLLAYLMCRNRLLWAKKHLPLKKQLSIYRLDLQKLFLDVIPHFYIDKNFPILKSFFWAILQFRKDFKKNYNNPVIKARLWGFLDFFKGRFGNCSEKIRALEQ